MKRQFTKEEMQIVNKHFFKCASAQFKNGKLKPLQNIIFASPIKRDFLKCWSVITRTGFGVTTSLILQRSLHSWLISGSDNGRILLSYEEGTSFKPTILFKGQTLEIVPLQSRTRYEWPQLPLLCTMILQAPVQEEIKEN